MSSGHLFKLHSLVVSYSRWRFYKGAGMNLLFRHLSGLQPLGHPIIHLLDGLRNGHTDTRSNEPVDSDDLDE